VALNTGGKWLANTNQTFQVSTGTTDTTFTISGGSSGLSKDEFLSQLNAQLSGTGVAASINATTGVLTMGSSKGFVFTASAAGVPAENAVTAGTYAKNTTDTFRYDMGIVQNYSNSAGDDTFSFAIQVDGTTAGTVTLGSTAATVDQIFTNFKTAVGTSGLEVIRQGNHMYLQGNKAFNVTASFAVGGNGTDDRTQNPFATGAQNNNGVAETGTVGTTTAGSLTSAAQDALTKVSTALSNLGTVQGLIGTGQNTLAYAIGLAQSQISSFAAAESRIRDTDVAAEAANLTKASVLQQASIAAMAQANSAPQAVLSLLRG
jgi:flagellin